MNNRIRELAEQAGFGIRQNEIYTAKLEHLPITDNMEKFAKLVIEEAAKAHLCNSDGVIGKYSDSDRYYFEQLMKKQLGLV